MGVSFFSSDRPRTKAALIFLILSWGGTGCSPVGKDGGAGIAKSRQILGASWMREGRPLRNVPDFVIRRISNPLQIGRSMRCVLVDRGTAFSLTKLFFTSRLFMIDGDPLSAKVLRVFVNSRD